MEEQAEPREETKHSLAFGSYAGWAGVILPLYVLSFGPVAMMEEKGVWQRRPALIKSFYRPLGWAYFWTPLHKPIGMYLRLWAPKTY